MPAIDTNKNMNYVHALVRQSNKLSNDLSLSTLENISIRTDNIGQNFCIMYLNKRTIGIIENLVASTKFSFLKHSSHVSIYEQPASAWRKPTLKASAHLLLKFSVDQNLIYNLTYYYDEFGYIVGRERSYDHPLIDTVIHEVNCSEIYLDILKDVFKVQSVACKKFGPQILDPYPSISDNYTNICLFQTLSKYFSLLKYHQKYNDHIRLFQQVFTRDACQEKNYLLSILMPNMDFSARTQFWEIISENIIFVQTIVALRLIEIFRQVHCNDSSVDTMHQEITKRLKAKLQDTINKTPQNTINIERHIEFLNFISNANKSREHMPCKLNF